MSILRMGNNTFPTPFDHQRFIGYVSQVNPSITKIHFPSSNLLKKFYYGGDLLHGGLVRNYVVIEAEGIGFLGKIVSISLPEKERFKLNESTFQNTSELHPTGEVEIQLAFDIFEKVKCKKGLEQYPPVGAKVYACSPKLLQKFLEDFGSNDEIETDDLLEIAEIPQENGYKFSISANALFNRHCAIVGTTGGGKSYTVAKIIEKLIEKSGAKIILIDYTGEYRSFDSNTYTESIKFDQSDASAYLHYKNLVIDDLYSIFRPSGQVQTPKLQEALRSLKIVQLRQTQIPAAQYLSNSTTPEGPKILNGLLVKRNTSKSPYLNYYYQNATKIENNEINFDMKRLANQIIEECAWEDSDKWGSIYIKITKATVPA